MTLEDKVNKIVGEIMTANVSDLHRIIREALIFQDHETNMACREAIAILPSTCDDPKCDSIAHDEAIYACMSSSPWELP